MKELLKIYWTFFKVGGGTFGGGYAMLPILRKEIVQKNDWLTEEKIIDFYAISQGLPGIIGINVSAFVGYSRKKIPGAIAAALGMVTPSLFIIVTIAMFLSNFKDNIYIGYAMSAISVCVCALILEAIIGMWKKGVKDFFGIALFAIMLIGMTFTKVSPILLVILSAVGGVVVKSIKDKGEK